MEAARCPLCRASIVHGSNTNTTNNNNTIIGLRGTGINNADAAAVPAAAVPGERALFRFSTENMFPTWLPLPAFSFEVVRRPAQLVHAAAAAGGGGIDATATEAGDARNNNNENNNVVQQQQQHQQTLLRRLLLLSGVVQMTAEEERVALEQLTEMFPQYDRQDLRAALRQRGSPEAVAESVLLGSWRPPPNAVVR